MAYQYETSPRKINPEYETQRKRQQSRKKSQKKKTSSNAGKKRNAKQEKAKNDAKVKFLITLNLFIIFAILFIIIYRNSLISQSFSQIQTLKSEATEIQKENEQLEISIQNSLNTNNIEQEAKELLGMQKLTSKQTVYLNLPKKDYVEPSTEEVIIEESDNIFSKIYNWFTDLF